MAPTKTLALELPDIAFPRRFMEPLMLGAPLGAMRE
jgi:hypothetical protein